MEIYLELMVEIPTKLTEEQKKLFKELQASYSKK